MAASAIRSFPRLCEATRSSKAFLRPMATAAEAPTYQVLHYKYVADILERRGPHRESHLDACKKAVAAKQIVIAGAVADPVDSALFIFENTSKEQIEDYVAQDPYYKNGLIAEYSIRRYLVVGKA